MRTADVVVTYVPSGLDIYMSWVMSFALLAVSGVMFYLAYISFRDREKLFSVIMVLGGLLFIATSLGIVGWLVAL